MDSREEIDKPYRFLLLRIYEDHTQFDDIEVGGTLVLNSREFNVVEKSSNRITVELKDGEEARFYSDVEPHEFAAGEVNERLAGHDDPFNYN